MADRLATVKLRSALQRLQHFKSLEIMGVPSSVFPK